MSPGGTAALVIIILLLLGGGAFAYWWFRMRKVRDCCSVGLYGASLIFVLRARECMPLQQPPGSVGVDFTEYNEYSQLGNGGGTETDLL